ncbi:PREDICTED: lethal(3)malignant brain tumor-like protein 3 isoform X2 [Nicrophorus vespilloides]|uniref:Lethal(3)malignant brain tumor-like protein 3 isoform X2 n=1 Tax=Nicrophorus vespilloides TaxID=110193 RepID=A0ABM1M1B7_NICVS|nr:PREDICTED: lethal(3)malignant brain tumor-like protein 3 isoform X2 [Nicrophorus vespilloides]
MSEVSASVFEIVGIMKIFAVFTVEEMASSDLVSPNGNPSEVNSILLNNVEPKVTITTTTVSQTPVMQNVTGHHMLPVVYIQTPSKITTNKSNSNNVIMNALPQIQIQNASKLAPQSLLIGNQLLQKPAIQKNGVTYLLKPVSKPNETTSLIPPQIPIPSISKFATKDGLQLNSVTMGQKFLLSPLSSMSNNRLSTTTTNSVQSQISLMLPTLQPKPNHVINLKLPEDKTILDVAKNSKEQTDPLFCNERIDEEAKNVEAQDKSYQISIVEDSVADNGYTISINEDEKLPKLIKHGVSILKKTYNTHVDRKENNPIPTAIIKSITTISDPGTKEVKIQSEHHDEGIAPPPPPPLVRKSERRRKSTICLRKDYDDIQEETEEEPEKMIVKDDVEISKLEDVLCEDEDVSKLLHWDRGVGSLPSTNIKFHINEFGMLEYLTDEEFKKMNLKRIKPKVAQQVEMRCLICGCYGMPSDFISPKYCSNDCQEAGEREDVQPPVKHRKKKQYFRKSDEFVKMESSEDENLINTSNENSSDKFAYPWTCHKKGFSWSKYLDHLKAVAAPVKLFKDPFPYGRNGFKAGMKLEGIDPQHPSYFCVLTVVETLGYRIRLHFDGYPDNYDFWVNADSMNIFPAGFCEKFGHTLHPPPDHKKDFNWNNYLKQTHSTAAAKTLFFNRNTNAIFPNGFRIGMKLEAVDRKNTALVCVATITDMMDNRILVHFDSWDDIYDYWADPTSPYIHPVGWCDKHGHNLTPPNESFTWDKYLKETKASAAPVRAFKQRPNNGFRRGMRLECVDKRVPRIIRVATVEELRENQLRIRFDGWPDRYSYWVDDDSTDIHPISWCQKTGHHLEPPLTPNDVYDFLECATIGCKGQGHIQGPIHSTHSSPKFCPYADENIDMEKILPDRLLSPDRQVEAVVPVSREPRDKISKMKNIIATKMAFEEPKREWSDDEQDMEFDMGRAKRIKEELEDSVRSDEPKNNTVLDFADVNLDEQRMRARHSKYLDRYVHVESDPRHWNCQEVMNFIASVPCCRDYASHFGSNRIDGLSFLMLNQQDLTEVLRFKLGPAITLYNCILMLRQTVIQCT